jgi:thioredoxin-like negative regulator of GroEL
LSFPDRRRIVGLESPTYGPTELIDMRTCVSLRLICLCCVWGSLPAAPAQEVEWRQDYGKARQEAVEKNRPLLIDVGTENCFFCKQLDMRTFKDPAIIALLNERCVPLRIDADQHPRLTEALRVEYYPTLVFANSEGEILGFQQGFIEAPALRERLNKLFFTSTLAGGGAPNPNREIEEAKRAIAVGDYARALALLKPVAETAKDAATQTQAKQLLQEMEQQAAGRCAEARQLVENGKVTQAVETVTELVRVYPGTKAAHEGGKLLVTLASRVVPRENSRSRIAHDLLDLARDDYRRQQYLTCLDRCENLIANYADQSESAEASKLAAEIKANPEWTKQACEQMTDRLGSLYLTLAESWLKKGQPQQAVFYLERVVKLFPNTRNADLAHVRLAQIQGPSSMQTPPSRDH